MLSYSCLMTRAKKVLAALAATFVAASLLISGGPAVAQGPETYGDYSLMFQRSAGQYKSFAAEAPYQWAWAPQSATESWIRFDTAANWAPGAATASNEHFVLDGGVVKLDGWGTATRYYKQTVTSQYLGDQACNFPIALAPGQQVYALWNVTSASYCLDATGTIQRFDNGAPIGPAFNFRHRQFWSYSASCSSPYVPNVVPCLKQREQWSDDNHRPMALYLDRTISIGKGRGMAFKIEQTVPSAWTAGQNAKWNY